jgi:hypothetical protein
LGNDGVTELSRKFEQLADDTKELVTDAVKTVNKDDGHGLSQYNAKVQEAGDKVTGGFGEKATRYPWVACRSPWLLVSCWVIYSNPTGSRLGKLTDLRTGFQKKRR